MRNVLMFALTFLSAATFAKTYSYEHGVVFREYPNAKACEADGYKWDGDENGLCIAPGEDTVTITKLKSSYKVTVETISVNAHQCSFEATNGKRQGTSKIVSSLPSKFYDERGNTIDTTCEVTVNFNSDKSVTVKTNGYNECSEFCGVNAFLDIDKAVIKK